MLRHNVFRICGSSFVDLESVPLFRQNCGMEVVCFWLVPGMLKSHVMQQRPAASGRSTPMASKCLKNPHVRYRLHSLKAGSIGDYIGDYYRAYEGGN